MIIIVRIYKLIYDLLVGKNRFDNYQILILNMYESLVFTSKKKNEKKKVNKSDKYINEENIIKRSSLVYK
jgi:hypothetical protein